MGKISWIMLPKIILKFAFQTISTQWLQTYKYIAIKEMHISNINKDI